MEIPDEVRREVVVEAPRERVWRAICEADQLVRWFPDKIAEIDLRPGGAIRIEWQDGEFDHGTVQVVEEPSRFVFRWHGAGFDAPETSVEFTLEAVEGGTRVVVVESGFSKVREEKRESAWHDNDGGWAKELGELKAYLEAA
ncbi:MAG TPA: SRPBCC domain-containing protein [Actinomycetota bacterium]|nr:SRPBCC domain-containing protein [Actinomycetota bacterium]